MLERQVVPPSPRPSRAVLALGAAVGLGTVAAVAAMHRSPCEQPPALVLVSTAPAPAMAPAPLAVTLPPAPLHVGCAGLRDDIGTREIERDVDGQIAARESGTAIDATIIGDDGCTIAMRVGTTLHLSWDGGATFTTIDVKDGGEYPAVSLVPGRLFWLAPKRHALGVLDAGARAMRWIDLAPLHFGDDDYPAVIAEHGWLALATEKSWFASHDDGKTWSALSMPVLATPKGLAAPAQIVGIAADGTVRAQIGDDVAPDSGVLPSDSVEQHAFEAAVTTGAWREVPVHTAPLVRAHGWVYTKYMDRFWGCGGTYAISATHGADTVTLASGLSDTWGNIGLVSAHGHAYMQHTSVIYALDGADATPIRGTPSLEPSLGDVGEVLAIDAGGGLLVSEHDRLVRWTKHGGWRVLVSTGDR
ncbi:MAG TPA: hypothetical protein VGM88_08815 [Kofleriaceae bacterium]|jgi:hypothetical protein